MDETSQLLLYRRARAALEGDRYTEAEYLCTQMLRAQRNDPNALTLLAQVAYCTGRESKALEYLQTAVRAHPKVASLRADLGHFYSDIAKFRRALPQFEKALKLNPDLTSAVAGIAEVYERQGKNARAKKILAPQISKGDTEPAIAETMMRVLIHEGDHDEAIALGRDILAQSPAESLPVRNICFGLARAYERCEQFEKAFKAAQRGNAMLAPAYDPEDQQLVESLIEYFTCQRLRELPAARESSELPIFIVGLQRSGSTLVERIVATHECAEGVGELGILHVMTVELSTRLGSQHPFPKCLDEITRNHVDEMSNQYLDAVRKLAPRADRVVNKDLANFLRLGFIQLLFPGARVIHCRRDPLDTCLSCYMERLQPFNAPFASDLTHLGLFYRQYDRLMDHWTSVLDLDIMEVQYEDLVADQHRVSKDIVEFCGLFWDEACLEFHSTDRVDRTLSYNQVRRPIYSSSIGRGERFGELLDPLRHALEDDQPFE